MEAELEPVSGIALFTLWFVTCGLALGIYLWLFRDRRPR